MGQSTDAILMYCVAIEENPGYYPDGETPEENDPNADKDDPRYLREHDTCSSEGICIEEHCSDSCTMYVVGYQESSSRAWRGSPVKVSTEKRYDPAPLLAYCKKYKLKVDKDINKGKPGWLLFSWWC